MVFLKSTTIGIDDSIQRFQNYLYGSLKNAWGISNDSDYDAYGRAYRNQTDDGYVPEAYLGGNEYKEIMFDDSKSAISFFSMGEQISYDDGNAVAPVSLIFFVNVDKLKPGLAWRGDEEVRRDVEKLCQVERNGFKMNGFLTGIDKCLLEFPGWRRETGVKMRDMHPLHVFRINFNLLYDITDSSTCNFLKF